MSGDGSKKKTDTSKKDEALPDYMTGTVTQQPFMPGWDNMLAQQLQAGGYGSTNDLLSQFQQIYTPMQVLDTNPPAPGTTPPPTTPPASNKPSWWRDEWGEFGDWKGASRRMATEGMHPQTYRAHRGPR